MAEFATSTKDAFLRLANAVKNLSNSVPTYTTGTYASRPAANTLNAGSEYFATDLQEQYLAVGTPGSKATAWLVIPSAGTELAYAQIITTQRIAVATTQNTPVDITGLSLTVLMTERPMEIECQAIGRFRPTTWGAPGAAITTAQFANPPAGQDGTFQIWDTVTGLNLNEAHIGFTHGDSEYRSLRWSARISPSTPGASRTFKVVGISKTTGVLDLVAAAGFPAFIRARAL